uniref:Uncharacterized protein n=1 Tax=Sipha flava TaxID=143950 RepID=A0A2S2R0Q7_9HEMI
MFSQSGIILPLNLTQASAHKGPSKYEPNIFLHCAQFLMHMPTSAMSATADPITISTSAKTTVFFESFIVSRNIVLFRAEAELSSRCWNVRVRCTDENGNGTVGFIPIVSVALPIVARKRRGLAGRGLPVARVPR